MTTADDVQSALLARISELAPRATIDSLLKLAEAYAWAVAPNQPHGAPPAADPG